MHLSLPIIVAILLYNLLYLINNCLHLVSEQNTFVLFRLHGIYFVCSLDSTRHSSRQKEVSDIAISSMTNWDLNLYKTWYLHLITIIQQQCNNK